MESLGLCDGHMGAAEGPDPGILEFEVAQESSFALASDTQTDALDRIFGHGCFGGFAMQGGILFHDFLSRKHGFAEIGFLLHDAAEVAFSVAAIAGILEVHGAAPIILKPRFWDERIDVVPGEAFIEGAFTELKSRIKACFFDGLLPCGEVEVFVPGVESGPVSPCGFDEIRATAVGAGDKAFNERTFWGVASEFNAPVAMEGVG